MTVALVAHGRSSTNVSLARARADVQILHPAVAVRTLGDGDLAIARLDVSAELDGIEAGLWELQRLQGAGVQVLNPPSALIAAHDKLATARTMLEAGVPHPVTMHVTAAGDHVPFEPPYVVKPRFGSWGRHVTLCEDRAALRHRLREISGLRWFQAHGALVQALVPPQGHDMRLVVAGGAVVGAVRRVAAPGEWRTNVALGARREPTVPTAHLCELAVTAATAVGADLVGVDLLPLAADEHTVLEVNGAVEFTSDYAICGDVFERALAALLPDPIAAVA